MLGSMGGPKQMLAQDPVNVKDGPEPSHSGRIAHLQSDPTEECRNMEARSRLFEETCNRKRKVLQQHLHLVQALQQQILKDADKVQMDISDILNKSILELGRLKNNHGGLRMTSTPTKEFMDTYSSPSCTISDIRRCLTFDDKIDDSGICEEKQCSTPSTEEHEQLSSNQHHNTTTLPYVHNVVHVEENSSAANKYPTLANNKDYVQNNLFSFTRDSFTDFTITQDAESDLTKKELNSTQIEEGSLTEDNSSHIFARQVMASTTTTSNDEHPIDQAYHMVINREGENNKPWKDVVDHDNHSNIFVQEESMCIDCQVCPHVANIHPGNQCSCNDIRLSPNDVFTDTVEGRQLLDHINKLQNRKADLEEKIKNLEVNGMTQTNSVDEHVLSVLELERSICKSEHTKIQIQLFTHENALLKKKLNQLQFDTQCLIEQNTNLKEKMNSLMEEKNITELCLAQAEQDRDLFVKEMNMVIEKCEELIRQKQHILSEKNHLTIEKQFMSKAISKLEIGNQRMDEELAIISSEKDKIAKLVKSIQQDLLTHTEEKLQLQLKLGDALTENNQLKRQLAESSDLGKSCQHLMKFNSNKINPELDRERSVITPSSSRSEQYKPFFHDQLFQEIKNLKAKNLMLWTSFCENGQKCQFLSKLVQDLKNDNNMLNVDLEERAKTNLVLESKIKNLIEDKLSCQIWITKLENQKEMLKLKLYDLQGNLHRYRDHINDDQFYKELLARHHQEGGYHTYCELCQGIYNYQHKAKLLAVEANRNITGIQRLLMEEWFQRDSIYQSPVDVPIPVSYTSSITAARRRASYEHTVRQEHTGAISLISEDTFTNMSDLTVE